MKSFVTFLSIGAVIAISVFGFLAMDMDRGGENHTGCLAATAAGSPLCPSDERSLGSFLFHANAWRSFSTGIIGSGITLIVLIAFVFTFAAIAFLKRERALLRAFRYARSLRKHLRALDPITSYLALYEHSPSYL